MFPPEPTNNPYQLLGNLWASLKRAGNDPDGGHWGEQAELEPDPTVGYRASLQFARPVDDTSWARLSKYIRSYAKASHWIVHSLVKRRTHVDMVIEYQPPAPKKPSRPKPHPDAQKTS